MRKLVREEIVLWKLITMFGEIIDAYVEVLSGSYSMSPKFPLFWFLEELPTYIRFVVASIVLAYLLMQTASAQDKVMKEDIKEESKYNEDFSHIKKNLSKGDFSDDKHNRY